MLCGRKYKSKEIPKSDIFKPDVSHTSYHQFTHQSKTQSALYRFVRRIKVETNRTIRGQPALRAGLNKQSSHNPVIYKVGLTQAATNKVGPLEVFEAFFAMTFIFIAFSIGI